MRFKPNSGTINCLQLVLSENIENIFMCAHTFMTLQTYFCRGFAHD